MSAQSENRARLVAARGACLIAALALGGAPACTLGHPGGVPDVTTEASADAASDVAIDAVSESGLDVVLATDALDANRDVARDVTSDVPTCPLPSGGFCTTVGCHLAPLSLPSCDAAMPAYDFYGPDFCTARLTVIARVAGWCVPCQNNAPNLQTMITATYAGRVRVILVYATNPDYSAPTPAMCQSWRSRYAETDIGTIDPTGATAGYFPATEYPAFAIVDSAGVIRYLASGSGSGISALRTEIDMLLAGH